MSSSNSGSKPPVPSSGSSRIKELQAKFSGKGGTSTPASFHQKLTEQQQKERQAIIQAQKVRERKAAIAREADYAGKLQARKRRSTVSGINIPELQRDEMAAEAVGVDNVSSVSFINDPASDASSKGIQTSVSVNAGASANKSATTADAANVNKQADAFFRRKSFVKAINTQGGPVLFDSSDKSGTAEDVYGSFLPPPVSQQAQAEKQKESLKLTKQPSDSHKSYFTRLCGYLKDPSLSSAYTLCVEMIRNELSRRKPPIQDAVDAGVVAIMVHFLQSSSDDGLLFESAWVLTNISCGAKEHTLAVVEAGAIPILIKHQSSSNHLVVWQTAWVLGNIAGESKQLRDLVLEANGLPAIIGTIKPNGELNLIRNATWTVSNLFRWKPLPDMSQTLLALPKIIELMHHPDQDVQVDAYWALSHISQGSDSYLQKIIDLKVHQDLLQTLESGVVNLIMPSLRIIQGLISYKLDEILMFVCDELLFQKTYPILSNYTLSARCTNAVLQILASISEKLSSSSTDADRVEKSHELMKSSRNVLAASNLVSIKETSLDALWFVYGLSANTNKWLNKDAAYLVNETGLIPRLFHVIGSQFHANHLKTFYPKSFTEAESIALDCLINLSKVENTRSDVLAIVKKCIQLDDSIIRMRKVAKTKSYYLTLICLRKSGNPVLSKMACSNILAFCGDISHQLLFADELFAQTL